VVMAVTLTTIICNLVYPIAGSTYCRRIRKLICGDGLLRAMSPFWKIEYYSIDPCISTNGGRVALSTHQPILRTCTRVDVQEWLDQRTHSRPFLLIHNANNWYQLVVLMSLKGGTSHLLSSQSYQSIWWHNLALLCQDITTREKLVPRTNLAAHKSVPLGTLSPFGSGVGVSINTDLLDPNGQGTIRVFLSTPLLPKNLVQSEEHLTFLYRHFS